MTATHAYIGIYEDIVRAVATDFGDIHTADFCARLMASGAVIKRVPVARAEAAILQPWPRVGRVG